MSNLPRVSRQEINAAQALRDAAAATAQAVEACRLTAIACYQSPDLSTQQSYEKALNRMCDAWIAEYEREQDRLAVEGVDCGE